MGKTRGRIPLSRDTYEKLIAFYRDHPGATVQAGRAASCSWQLAKRVWSGPPFVDYTWAVPAIMLFDEEKTIAMARAREAELERVRAEERRRVETFNAAREEEIEALKQENLILKGARGDVLQALALAADLAPAMKQLSTIIKDACKPQANGAPPAISAKDAMSLMGRHALIMQRAVAAASTVLDQGKVTRGEPTSILGIKPVAAPQSYEDAIAELEQAGELLEHARQLGAASPRVIDTEAEDAPAPKRTNRTSFSSTHQPHLTRQTG
jgi:hypothetical protein